MVFCAVGGRKMIKLTKAVIHKYKCIEKEQTIEIEPDVTVLVGMNESGKTSLLEALAKVNYFDQNDTDYKFNMTHDYPRKQKKAAEKSKDPIEAVTLHYEIDDDLLDEISKDLGFEYSCETISYTKKYDNSSIVVGIYVDFAEFIKVKLEALHLDVQKYESMFTGIKSKENFNALMSKLETDGEKDENLLVLKKLESYFPSDNIWNNPIENYVWRFHIKPNMPRFMYYDDYYMLPSRLSIDKINEKRTLDNSEKTGKALLELADIDVDSLVNADSYEDYKAELEATQEAISEELFKYWTTNTNLRILFDIDKIEDTDRTGQHIVEHILDIRVENLRSRVSLPLANRSKGFNWFFSFLVWFEKIQENKDVPYILLLDEPGLNLHAMAQRDLLNFIENLSSEYQIVYTTHSPFMIESDKLNRVRTVLEKEDGTHVSDCLQEKDPNTIFPLQAALGYTIAQNLFVSENNLLVEGIADLVYLTVLSNMLKSMNRTGLDDDITIVPVGGADKVATFISLLRGNELNMLCLLDTFTEQSAKARLDNMVAKNIIKDKNILFYHDVLECNFADVEDMFSDDDYLSLFNGAFSKKISSSDIDSSKPIMQQLKEKNGKKEFNHYTPANYLAQNVGALTLSDATLDNFEKLFKIVNKKL